MRKLPFLIAAALALPAGAQAQELTRATQRLEMAGVAPVACVISQPRHTPLPDCVVPTISVPPSKFCSGRASKISFCSTPWIYGRPISPSGWAGVTYPSMCRTRGEICRSR